MASEYEKYQQKVARKKAVPEPSVKIGDEVKPVVEPRKRDERKRH